MGFLSGSALVPGAAPASGLARLGGCGVVTLAIYLAAFTLPYPVPSGLTKPLQHFARMTGPSLGPTLLFAGALVGLFAAYVVAVHLSRRLEGRRGAYLIVGGVALLGALALLPLYPIFSLDIFYYMSADRIWSVYHENPFVVPPLQAANDPFFPYTAWGHYPLPYGPLWPWITRATSAFGGGDVERTLLAFKSLGVVGYLLDVGLLAWAAGAFRPRRRLTALCVFAWNPLVLLELAGNGHNDSIALAPAILAIGLWARRESAPAAISIMVSFLTKATVAVVGPALLVASCRRALAERRLVRWLLLHVIPLAALYALAWVPFWSDNGPGFLREAGQYYQSLTSLVAAAIPAGVPASSKDHILRGVQLVLLAGFAAFYVSQLRCLGEEGRDALQAVWRLLLVYFLVVTPFFSPWYIVWPTAVAALVADRRTTTLTTLLCVGCLATYLVQFVVRPLVGAAVGMPVFSAAGLLVAASPMLAGWILLRRTTGSLHSGGERVVPSEETLEVASASPRPATAGRGGA